MGRFATVYVDFKDGEIICDPPKAQLYFLAEPDSMQWVINGQPEGAVGMEIAFQGDAPFTDFGTSLGDGPTRLVATGNRMRSGYFKYTIRFFDDQGAVMAETDPGVIDDPLPPGWPEYP